MTGWKTVRKYEDANDRRTPYVDWFVEVEKEIRPDLGIFREVKKLGLLPEIAAERLFGKDLQTLAKELLASSFDEGRDVPIPEFAEAPPLGRDSDWLPNICDLKELVTDLPAKNGVIVGIIDEGTALGHQRFRKKCGCTRFLHNWQQGGQWRKSDAAIPYGRDMFQKEINEKLVSSSRPTKLSGDLDEDAFNRTIGIADYVNIKGSRTVDRHSAHGTHVLDLATGIDCHTEETDWQDRQRILSVTLPPRPVVGLAGTFLAYFAVQGMLRLVDLADHLSELVHKKRGAIPIVINMSYGQQAGPKDGQALFERIVAALNAYREEQCYLPVRLVMPAGNDNLQRCRARWRIGKKCQISLPWRVLPEDQSSNFVEIWSSPVKRRNSKSVSPLKLTLTNPNGEKFKLAPGKPKYFDEIKDQDGNVQGHVYTRRVRSKKNGTKYRYNHVICVAPTLLYDTRNDWSPAPSGIWKLDIKNLEKKAEVYAQIQVDQASRPDEDTSGRSYFDHCRYKTHLDDGRIRDSYRYPLTGKDDNQEPAIWQGPVQRKGTHNSIASYSEILVIGGYRESDGRPATYSSSTQGDRSAAPGRKLLTCALPSETAPHHWGQLAAGTRSGSTAALSGTSFATAHMTRAIVDALLEALSSGSLPQNKGSNKWAEEKAAEAESKNPYRGDKCHELKVGYGRLPAPKYGEVERI